MRLLLSAYRLLYGTNSLIQRVALGLGMAIVAFAVLALFAAAVERHVTGRGYAWMNDLPPFLLPWCVFPLMGVLLRSGRHISVDVAPTLLPAGPAQILRLIVGLVALVSGIYFCNAGIEATGFFHMLGEVTETEIQFPFWFLYAAFPTGFGILSLFALELVLREILLLAGMLPGEEAKPT
ncbi:MULTISPECIES: TRAP transporter small permease [unclassified Minwuia]|uniref:TRAP transporter small permease n=1 Tax=unclassified Minwuia TaxID=2618799 RepID=UPI0024783CD8|nr:MULTISPECIES: TRAP transporter small permease [unclassified Minwuia]